MKAVLQRVTSASVEIDGKINGEIKKGLAVLLGIMDGDTKKQAEFLAKKLCELRIFEDENQKMNLSVMDVDGDILIVSQFTLGADCSHGRRPSFIKAARPDVAIPLYEYFIECVENNINKKVQTGIFGADMKFTIVNDGPVTIIFDTEEMGCPVCKD